MYVEELGREKDGVELKVFQDERCDSPREWDNVTTIVCREHNRYNLPMELDGFSFADFDNADEACQTLIRDYGARNIVPIWMYDHGQVAFRVGPRSYPFDCPWDSSFCGFAFTTDQQSEGIADEAIDGIIAADIQDYSDWASGEVYAYSITTPDGKGEDSCGGFIGESIRTESHDAFLAAVKAYRERKAKEDAEREHWESRDVTTV